VGIISVGIDHEHASLDFLEKVTVLEDDWGKVLRTLMSHRNIYEAVFVSTCLRTEVFAVIDRFHGAVDEITETIAEATGIDAALFSDKMTIHFDKDVPNHLFQVTSGLKSIVPGEFEILGQIRRALEFAQIEHTSGNELDELFTRAISTGRKVRSSTNISKGTTSFAQAAVQLAAEQHTGGLKDAEVVIIGAGQLATGIVKSLLSTNNSVAKVTICNRTVANAQSISNEVQDARVHVATLQEIDHHMKSASLVISAVETLDPLISKASVASFSHDLLVMDLSVPRSVSPEVEELPSIRRIDLEILKAKVDGALSGRQEAVLDAMKIVDAETEKYLDDQRARGAVEIIRSFRDDLDKIIDVELQRRLQEFTELSAADKEKIDVLVRSIVGKISHKPTAVLKDTAGTDQGARLTESIKILFDL
jgi:glutamyl-tRNA reductase